MLSAIGKSLAQTLQSEETNPFDPAASTLFNLSASLGSLDSYLSRIQNQKTTLTPSAVQGAVFCALLLLQPLAQNPQLEDHKRALQQAACQLTPDFFADNIFNIRSTLNQLSRLDLKCTDRSFAHAVRIILRLEEKRALDVSETETLQSFLIESDSIKSVRLALTSIIKDRFPESSELHINAQGYHQALTSNGEHSDLQDLIPHYHTKLEELFALSKVERFKGKVVSNARSYLGSWSPI